MDPHFPYRLNRTPISMEDENRQMKKGSMTQSRASFLLSPLLSRVSVDYRAQKIKVCVNLKRHG
jgi:hypothetical protein